MSDQTKALIENLRRASRAAIVDPLISRLASATKTRFRRQGSLVAKAIRERIVESVRNHAWPRFRLSEADNAAARNAASYALSGFFYTAWLAAHRKATAAAYSGGAGMAAGMLDADEPDALDDLDGPGRTGELAEQQIDRTTRDRVMAAIEDGADLSAILAGVAMVFRDGVDSRSDTIALSEVSNAFHDGMMDAAEFIAADIGEDIEKLWEAEDDACEDCQDCADEDWVDLDFTYPAFGVDEPEGHQNCRCSLSLRRAEA